MTALEIKPITRGDLCILEPLLQASHGPLFDVQDELDYFEAMPHHSWFYLSRDKTPQGFIRCFEIEKDLYQIELFVTLSDLILEDYQALIEYFKKHHQLGNVRVRFEIAESRVQLLDLLDERFQAREIKRFLHMEKYVLAATEKAHPQLTEASFEKVATILSVLKTYTPEYLKSLYEQQKLYIYSDPEPVAALQIEETSVRVCEVITLATEATKLRCGYAEKLLQDFFAWASVRFDKVELKVNQDNTPALRLYQKMGFESVPRLNQQWWYVSLA